MWNNQTVGGCLIRSGLWPKTAESRGGDLIDGACTNGMHKIKNQKITRSSTPTECIVGSINEIWRFQSQLERGFRGSKR